MAALACRWYNQEHHHTGIGLLTPATVHYGQAVETIAARQEVLVAAYKAHPERFVCGTPRPPALPTAVWSNPPDKEPGVEQLSVALDRQQGSATDESQPIFLQAIKDGFWDHP